MAEPDVDEDLFADLYDGDDNDTAQTTINTEPEPQTAHDEFKQDEPESMPTIAAGSMPAQGADNNKPATDYGMGSMEGVQDHGDYPQHMQEVEERPIGTKEDG